MRSAGGSLATVRCLAAAITIAVTLALQPAPVAAGSSWGSSGYGDPPSWCTKFSDMWTATVVTNDPLVGANPERDTLYGFHPNPGYDDWYGYFYGDFRGARLFGPGPGPSCVLAEGGPPARAASARQALDAGHRLAGGQGAGRERMRARGGGRPSADLSRRSSLVCRSVGSPSDAGVERAGRVCRSESGPRRTGRARHLVLARAGAHDAHGGRDVPGNEVRRDCEADRGRLGFRRWKLTAIDRQLWIRPGLPCAFTGDAHLRGAQPGGLRGAGRNSLRRHVVGDRRWSQLRSVPTRLD